MAKKKAGKSRGFTKEQKVRGGRKSGMTQLDWRLKDHTARKVKKKKRRSKK